MKITSISYGRSFANGGGNELIVATADVDRGEDPLQVAADLRDCVLQLREELSNAPHMPAGPLARRIVERRSARDHTAG